MELPETLLCFIRRVTGRHKDFVYHEAPLPKMFRRRAPREISPTPKFNL